MKSAIKNSLQVYDEYSSLYAEHTFQRLMQFQLNQFISMLPKGAKVLDIGSGSGRDCYYFNDYGVNVVGIDLSDNMIKEAKKRAPGVKFKKMDMRNLSFSKDSFDGIWVMATLSDVSKKEAPLVLKEVSKVLKSTGTLYLAVKEGDGEQIEVKPQYGNLERFYSYYNQKELESLLINNGFVIKNSLVTDDAGQNWIEIFAKLSP